MYFVKLFQGFLDSTINEEAYHIRLVWIACLLLADKNGNFRSTPQALSRRANVTIEEAEEALDCLSSPDPYSSSTEADGRRIQRVSQNEWTITNFKKYKLLKDPDEEREKAAERKRKSRARKMKAVEETPSQNVTGVTPSHTPSHDVTESHAIEIEIENISAEADSDIEDWLNEEEEDDWDLYQEDSEFYQEASEFLEAPSVEDFFDFDFESIINRLLDRWGANAVDEYGASSQFVFKKRYPELEELEGYENYHRAFQYIHSQLEDLPEVFVAFCFETWKNWNNPKIKNSKKGDLSGIAGIGFPSIKWLIENHERLVTEFNAISDFSPSFFRREVFDA